MRQLNISQNSWVALVAIVLALIIGFYATQAALNFQLLASDVDSGTTSSASGLEFYTGNGINELTMLRGCSDEDVIKFDDGSGVWSCQADSTTAVTGAGVVALDLGSNGDDSTAIERILTIGDTNSVFTESPADELLIDLGNNWPTSDDALAISGTAVTGSAVDDQLLLGSGAATAGWVAMPDCDSALDFEVIHYTAPTNTFACGSLPPPNSFETWTPDLGTSIVADSETDTATFTSTTGTVSITGSAAGDSLDFDAVDVNCSNCLTTTEVSGLDISDDTNLAAGRSLTLSGDSVEADAELYTDTSCIWFEDPTAVDDFQSIWRNGTANAITITGIWAESDQTVNFDLQIDDGTPADVNGTDISPAAGEAEDTTLSGDTTLDVGERLDLAITSVSGTPTWVSICWTYTWNE